MDNYVKCKIMGLFGSHFGLLGNLITGIAHWFTGNDSGKTDPLNEGLDAAWNGMTGRAMTPAQLQAAERNEAFTREREDLAWQRSIEADNTRYQRQVADMSAAGLNPVMAAGASPSAPAASSSPTGTAVGSAGNLGSLLSLIGTIKSAANSLKLGREQLKVQKDLGEKSLKIEEEKAAAEIANKAADTANKNADTANKNEDTRGKGLSNDFFERMQGVREESERLANDLTRKRGDEVDANIDKLKSGKALDEELAKTEGSKRDLYVSRELLNKATAENIVAMRPYLQAELSARSEAERAAAKVSAVDAAYRNGLISAGAIEAAVRETNASATEKEVNAKVAEVEKDLKGLSLAMKNGDFSTYTTGEKNVIMDALYQGLSLTSQAILGK